MINSIGLTIVGIIYLLLILIMYLSKKKYSNLRSTIYKFLIFLTLTMLITEICYTFTIKNRFLIPNVNQFFCRVFLFLVIIWAVGFFFYVKNLDSKNESSKKKKITFISIFIISAILCITDSFFEMKFDDGLYLIYGPASVMLYVMVAIIIVFLYMTLLKSKYPNYLKNPIYFIIIVFVLDTEFNFFIMDINDVPFFLSFVIIGLYFTIESQDRLLLEELEKATDAADKANIAKTTFLSSISHEIRTPMSTIIGLSELMLKDENMDKKRIMEDTENIYKASLVLLDLINNILDISEIESGKEKLLEKNYVLSDVLKNVYNNIKPIIDKKNLNLKFDISENTPSEYYGDFNKVYKILTSVILYVINYINYGDVIIGVDYKKSEEGIDFLNFTISNTSHTTNEDAFKIDFDNFLKIGDNMQNIVSSEILSFVVAKKLVEIINNGSCVEIINDQNEGTKYIIKLNQKKVGSDLINNTFL